MAGSFLSKIFFDKHDREIIGMVDKVRGAEKYRNSISALIDPNLHPDGICLLASRREVRYAYAVLNLLSMLDVGGDTAGRLRALEFLHSELVNNSEIANSYNTGRVLVQIMKELVRTNGSDVRRLKLAHDFHSAASGKIRIVRTMLNRYNLLEMPEACNQASFDNHVHDASTKGRKTPTHLILDAWIKGIRSVTVVYYNHVDPAAADELLKAADIMDIRVRIGIEYKTMADGRQADLIWTTKGFSSNRELLQFLAQENTRAIMALGREVSKYNEKYTMKLFEWFHREKLPEIAAGIGLVIQEPSADSFLKFVGLGQASRLHIAEFVSVCITPIAVVRKTELESKPADTLTDDEKQQIEFINSNGEFLPGVVMARWLPKYDVVDTDMAAEPVPELLKVTPAELCGMVRKLTDNRMVTLNLTDMCLYDVLDILWKCRGGITHLEVYNMKDWYDGRLAHIDEVMELKDAINAPTPILLKRLLLDRFKTESEGSPAGELYKTILHNLEIFRGFYRDRKLQTRIGSDSTSRVWNTHGMGFVFPETLPPKARRLLASTRGKAWEKLPIHTFLLKVTKVGARRNMLSELLSKLNAVEKNVKSRNSVSWEVLSDTAKIVPDGGNITTLGGSVRGRRGANFESIDTVTTEKLGISYLNSTAICWLKIMAGFIPAGLTFYFSQNLWFLQYFGALIWFFITGVRNIFQAVLGRGGIKNVTLLRWGDQVNWARISDSLMYTGFSVVLLELLVRRLFLERIMHVDPAHDSLLIFTVIAIANGVYISGHNYFRGLSTFTIVINIFRSFLAIPVAVAYTFLLAELLHFFGVSDGYGLIFPAAAIISKFASDTVAGIVEGYADMRDNIIMRSRDYRVKLAQMYKCYAKLEVMLPEQDASVLLMKPKKLAAALDSEAMKIQRELVMHALDMLYFWYYLPRASKVFTKLIKNMAPEEARLTFYLQQILKREKLISKMMIDGLLGANFADSLSFYLSFHKKYLEKIKKLSVKQEQDEEEQQA